MRSLLCCNQAGCNQVPRYDVSQWGEEAVLLRNDPQVTVEHTEQVWKDGEGQINSKEELMRVSD